MKEGCTPRKYKKMYEKSGRLYKTTGKREYIYYKFLRSHLERDKTDKGMILDVGCDSGIAMKGLGVRRYVGLDISKSFVQKGRKLFREPFFVIADACALPFKNGSFDKVICLETIEHILYYKNAFDDMKNVLRGGGELIIATPSRYRWLIFPPNFLLSSGMKIKILHSLKIIKRSNVKGVGDQHVKEFSAGELKKMYECSNLKVKHCEVFGLALAKFSPRFKKIEKELCKILPATLKKHIVIIGRKS